MPLAEEMFRITPLDLRKTQITKGDLRTLLCCDGKSVTEFWMTEVNSRTQNSCFDDVALVKITQRLHCSLGILSNQESLLKILNLKCCCDNNLHNRAFLKM